MLIPTLLVIPFTDKTSGTLVEDLQPVTMSAPTVKNELAINIPVYRSAKDVIENIPLEEYVVGVVASEMPAEFEVEALKAQALAARTLAVNRMLNVTKLGTPEGAQVTDSFETHQAYKDHLELKKQWGADYEQKIKKITEAVNATAGHILTYNSTPIDASFFSTSNGYTENSEEYWGNEYPYLRSVASHWDENAPKYLTSETISVTEFESKLGVKINANEDIGKIIARTSGNRVATVQFGDKKASGRIVRETLKLRSSDFTWVRKGNEIVITTKGYGHGVGMSQYGANGMAQEGKNYQDIVKHYYQGIEISPLDPFVPKITASK